MALRGAQITQFQEALLSAYDGSGLEQMVRVRLDEDLAVIAGGANLGEVMFNLILWAERTGRTGELVAGALAGNPGNAELKAFAAQYQGGGVPAPSGGSSAAAAAGGPSQAINTQGGAFIGGNVSTGGGAFIGRDQIISGDQEDGDKAPPA